MSNRDTLLQALATLTVATVEDIETHLGWPRNKVRDTINDLRKVQLVGIERDDVTHLPAYRLTEAGKKRLKAQTLSSSENTQPAEVQITGSDLSVPCNQLPAEEVAVIETPQPYLIATAAYSDEKIASLNGALAAKDVELLDQAAVVIALRRELQAANDSRLLALSERDKARDTLYDAYADLGHILEALKIDAVIGAEDTLPKMLGMIDALQNDADALDMALEEALALQDRIRELEYALSTVSTAAHPAEPVSDMVNQPPHYQGKVECIDAIESALGPDGFTAYCRGNALKYTFRAGKKGDAVQDLAKAQWYLRRIAA